MNPVSRKNYILDALKKTGEVTVIRLSEDLNVTSETIRRDLSQLADEGQLIKIHGGALRKQIFREDNFSQRLKLMRAEKESIGRAAVSLISANDTLFIDSCTTTLIFSALIPAVPLTVFTNSSLIAESIKQNNSYSRVHVLGGEYNLEFRANLGAAVVEQIAGIQADICFLGAGGISVPGGILVKNIDEAHVSKAMLRRSKKKIILADHSKFGQEGVMSIATIDQVDNIITDQKLDSLEYRAVDFQNKLTIS